MIVQNAKVKTQAQLDWEAALQLANEFDGLPEWATYTTSEAVTAIHNAIEAGKTLAQIQASITSLPNTFPGMKTGFNNTAADIVAIRNILEKMAKMLVYLRDRTT